MSAFQHGKPHVATLAYFYVAVVKREKYYYFDVPKNVLRVANIFLKENDRSVSFRYKQKPGIDLFVDANEVYNKAVLRHIHDPVCILKAAKSLAYQSCETDDWENTDACLFIEEIIDYIMTKDFPGHTDYRAIPGWDNSEGWLID
jgi:hypothetical protein